MEGRVRGWARVPPIDSELLRKVAPKLVGSEELLALFEPLPESAPYDENDEDVQSTYFIDDPEIRAIQAICQAGDAEGALADLQVLLQTGTKRREELRMALDSAVQSGSVDMVQMLLSFGVRADVGTIRSAIRVQSVPMLSLFLEYGWKINERVSCYDPPLLSYAIRNNRASECIIAWFLSNGADPNAACEMDITPLSVAIGVAPYSVVEQLLSHCPATAVLRGQLLHAAAGREVAEDCDAILQLALRLCPHEINALEYSNDIWSWVAHNAMGLGTPLHNAAKVGRLSAVRMLIASGADTSDSIRDTRGYTASEVAEREGHCHVAEELRRLRDTTGTTSLAKL